MDYIVNQTKQIGVEADAPEEAVKKVLNGEGAVITSSFSAQPRPRPTSPALVKRTEQQQQK